MVVVKSPTFRGQTVVIVAHGQKHASTSLASITSDDIGMRVAKDVSHVKTTAHRWWRCVHDEALLRRLSVTLLRESIDLLSLPELSPVLLCEPMIKVFEALLGWRFAARGLHEHMTTWQSDSV